MTLWAKSLFQSYMTWVCVKSTEQDTIEPNILVGFLIFQYKSGRIFRWRGVAQLGSAPAWGVGGRRCESDRPDHAQFVLRRA